MESVSYNLFHSAKGTTWSSSNHKYIRKEGNRYIYPDDMKSSSKPRKMVDTVGDTQVRAPYTSKQIANHKASSDQSVNSSSKPRKLVSGTMTDVNGNQVRVRGVAASRAISNRSPHYDKASGERLSAAQYFTRNQNGNVVSNGQRMTPSEYRAQQQDKALKSKSSAESNSSTTESTSTDSKTKDKSIKGKTTTSKSVSSTPTQGLKIHTPIPKVHRSTGHVIKAPGSGKKTPLSAGKVSKYNAGAIKPSSSHGMTLNQYLRSNSSKGTTSSRSSSSSLSLSSSSTSVDTGKKTVDNILSKLKSQSVSRDQDQKIRKETEVRERELQRRHNSK